MEENNIGNPNILTERFQNILTSLSKCKIDFISEKDETKKLREVNSKLEAELQEIRELEKSHRYHLQTSREMIENLQETVSQLVYLKRDVKKIKEEMAEKDAIIAAMEKEKECLIQKHSSDKMEFSTAHEKQIAELTAVNERKVQQVVHDSDTQVAQFTCIIEELRGKIQEMETDHRDKMNVVVLEYEEKIQRAGAQVAQLQEQLARQAARTDANIDAYRRRLDELEEKLKQCHFKQYLAQSSYPPFDSQVERPYSVEREFPKRSADLAPVPEVPKPSMALPSPLQQQQQQHKPAKQNTLQVMYYNQPLKNDKKGQFHLSKKRKLYSEKDLQ